MLLAAVFAFVGSHLVMSHVLRAPIAGALGRGWFQLLYSAVSLALLLAIVVAFHQAPHVPVIWSSDNLALQIVCSVATCFAAVLFVASLFNNPALVGARVVDLSTRPPLGVYLVTRHPMMFAIAIWSLAQIAITPTARNLIAFGGFTVLALVGSHLQDGKKIAQTGREWKMWASRTPFWPDLRNIGKIGVAWPVGIALWVVATGFETRTALAPVGLWYFLPNVI